MGSSFWQSATSERVRGDGSRFFSQEHSGKSHELQQGKFQLDRRRKKYTARLEYYWHGPGKNSLGDTLNSTQQGPEQCDVTLKLGVLGAGDLTR